MYGEHIKHVHYLRCQFAFGFGEFHDNGARSCDCLKADNELGYEEHIRLHRMIV